MPRGPRLDAPGCAHHVMARGIEGRRIFLGEEDRLDFVERLGRLLPEEHWRCFAWALMPNHVHLVLRGLEGGLSRLMARLNTGYARGFNRRHRRGGYLFQNRFKSRPVKDDLDLMGLVVYAHGNPLTAGLVDSLEALERHPWCGHSALMGHRPPLVFESVGASLSLFADHEAEARRCIRERMRELVSGSAPGTDPNGLQPDARAALAPAAGRATSKRSEAPGRPAHIQLRGARAPAPRIEELIAEVSGLFGVSTDEVCSPCQRRAAARARAAVAHLAVRALGIQAQIVATALRVSPSAVSHALRRGKAVVEAENIRIATPAGDPRHRPG